MTVQNDLDTAFRRARDEARAVLIPYLTAGYPDTDRYVDLAVCVLDAGADALEIGIPFSDSLLDGVSIQRAQARALDDGVTPARCIAYAEEIHSRTGKPLLFMGAFNPILAYGVDRFCEGAASAGVTGCIIPDVPFEEGEELRLAAERNGLHSIAVVAPTSMQERLQRVCGAASGFVYCISVAGVTGARAGVAGTAKPLVEAVRRCTDVPVAVGFGIADAAGARSVASFADGVAVGSAYVNLIDRTAPEERERALEAFTRDLAGGLQRVAV